MRYEALTGLTMEQRPDLARRLAAKTRTSPPGRVGRGQDGLGKGGEDLVEQVADIGVAQLVACRATAPTLASGSRSRDRAERGVAAAP